MEAEAEALQPVEHKRSVSPDFVRGDLLPNVGMAVLAAMAVGVSFFFLFDPQAVAALCVFFSIPIFVVGATVWRPKLTLRSLVFLVTCFSVTLSVATTQWPLRIAFWMSRPAVERLAEKVRSGETVGFPRRAGVFLIVEGRMKPERYVFLVAREFSGGLAGFVSASQAELQENWRNYNRVTSLSDDEWIAVTED